MEWEWNKYGNNGMGIMESKLKKNGNGNGNEME